MRVAEPCTECSKGRALVYSVVRFGGYLVRYKRCTSCSRTSKSIVLLTSKQNVASTEPTATIDAGGKL